MSNHLELFLLPTVRPSLEWVPLLAQKLPDTFCPLLWCVGFLPLHNKLSEIYWLNMKSFDSLVLFGGQNFRLAQLGAQNLEQMKVLARLQSFLEMPGNNLLPSLLRWLAEFSSFCLLDWDPWPPPSSVWLPLLLYLPDFSLEKSLFFKAPVIG